MENEDFEKHFLNFAMLIKDIIYSEFLKIRPFLYKM